MAKKQATKPATTTLEQLPDATAFNPLPGGELISMESDVTARQMLMPASGGASEMAESASRAIVAGTLEMVRTAMMMAKEFPRNEMKCYTAILGACTVPSFAEKAIYEWEQGSGKNRQVIEGPTVHLLKEIGRQWGNVRSGAHMIADTINQRTLRCYAWDLQTGNYFECDVTFGKVVFRKYGGDREGGEWRQTNEQELLGLNNAQASRGVRNCLKSVIPDFVVSEAMLKCRETMQAKIKADPKGFLKNLIVRFQALGISVEEIEGFVGFDLEKLDAKQLKYLSGVASAIDDGSMSWQEYIAKKAAKEGVTGESPPKSVDELKQRIADVASGKRQKDKPKDPDAGKKDAGKKNDPPPAAAAGASPKTEPSSQKKEAQAATNNQDAGNAKK